MSDLNNVVFGKNSESHIVNITVRGQTVFIFKEIDGKVVLEKQPYVHWLLSPKRMTGWSELKGNQHFKYIKEYPNMSDDQYKDLRGSVWKLGLYNVFNFSEAFMIKNGYTYFKNMKVNEVSMLSWDIETTGLDGNAPDAKVLLITNAFRKNGVVEKRTFNVEEYDTQIDMINDWCKWVQEKDPSLLIGHNIMIYDLPYMHAIMQKHGQEIILGRLCQPIEVEDKVRELRKDGSQSYSYKRINIFGREIIDTFFLAIKADIARKYTTYGLKGLVKEAGLEKADRTYYDASKIKTNWHIPEERAKIISYAEDDADDPIKLFDLMIPSFFYLTPHIPKPFQLMIESATGSQINSLMVRSYLQDGFSVAKADEVSTFDGGISFGNPGIYNNVFKADISSLYPSIMRNYKIFPYEKDFNNNFLKALEYFTLERLKNKKIAKDTGDNFYKDLEQSQKIVINSSFGFMGASGLNYNCAKGAADITRYGREILNKSIMWATGHTLNKTIKNIKNSGKPNEEIQYHWTIGEKISDGEGFVLVNADTDSLSVSNNSFLSKTNRENFLIKLNAQFPEMIRFEDDGYYSKVVILKAKNYILKDEDGKIKLRGSSLRDQKKEQALREMLDVMIKDLIDNNGNNCKDIYVTYIKETMKPTDIRRWSTKKTITKPVLNCATDPTARLNERKVYDAIAHTPVQEGDKAYLFPCIKSSVSETKLLKNGKIKTKVIKETGLKLAEEWANDHDPEKLVERVYATVEILSGVLDMSQFTDYTLVKNKVLLDNLVAI